jgi:ribosome-binding protein aMBF1 (putative translation factor)
MDAVEILDRAFIGDNTERRARVDRAYENAVIGMLIYNARTAAGLTQSQLAKLIGTDQAVISRLEDADYEGHSLTMLRRIAHALGKKIEIRFVDAA